MFSSSYKIGTIFGIPIKLDMSLIILFILLFDRDRMMYSIIFTFGLLISIVLHELGHSLVAIRYKCRIREIVLMFMGGAAVMDRMPRRPIQEFLMAIAGPAVSLLIGIACLYLRSYIIDNPSGDLPGEEGLGYKMAIDILKELGLLNLLLVAFNLLPAFPMDGGRIFRAMLTPKFGRVHATRYAANMGKLFAVLFVVFLSVLISLHAFLSRSIRNMPIPYEVSRGLPPPSRSAGAAPEDSRREDRRGA